MKNFKGLFFTLCGLLCFGVAQAQWISPAGSNTYTTDNVGIDTGAPAAKLVVNAGSSRGFEVLSNWGNTHIAYSNGWSYLSGKGLIFRTNGNYERMRITQGGNVGIGTSAPSQKLDINGDLRVRGNDIYGNSSLVLRGASGGYVETKSNSSTWGLVVREYNSTDYGNIEVTGAGLGLGYRTSGSHLMIGTSGNVGIGLNNPQVKLDVNGDITTSSAHRRGKIRLWKESNAADNRVSHAFGTEAFYNTYGPGSAYANSVGHKFYVHGNELAAQIGVGGSGAPGTRQNSRFYGDVQIGSYETFSDEGFEMMGVNSCFVPTRDCTDDLGVSSNRWRNLNYCGSLISTSDRNLKSNIKDMDYGLAEIMEMRPVSYTYKQREDEGTKLGLIAQELQPIVSEIVKSDELVGDENGNKVKKAREHLGVDYVALIPVLIKGMQEQQVLIEEQQARIDQLETLISKGNTPSQEEAIPQNNFRINAQPTGKVFQNNPNPFKNTTVINYELPKNTTQARLVVTDLLGKQVANYNLDGNQKTGQVTVQANGLASGTYVYTLVADGTLIDSNKMIVAK